LAFAKSGSAMRGWGIEVWNDGKITSTFGNLNQLDGSSPC
jgi:hypothetical protein